MDYKRKIIENNFELMNGSTIVVTTEESEIPKHFKPIENLEELKKVVNLDMDGHNFNAFN